MAKASKEFFGMLVKSEAHLGNYIYRGTNVPLSFIADAWFTKCDHVPPNVVCQTLGLQNERT